MVSFVSLKVCSMWKCTRMCSKTPFLTSPLELCSALLLVCTTAGIMVIIYLTCGGAAIARAGIVFISHMQSSHFVRVL